MGADYIGPVVDWLLGVLRSDEMSNALADAGLDPFGEFKKSWNFASTNWPPVAVLGKATAFDEDRPAFQSHELSIRFGVNGADTDKLAEDTQKYMTAITNVVDAAEWAEDIKRVFVTGHDYGPLFGTDGGFAKFPQIHLEVDRWAIRNIA